MVGFLIASFLLLVAIGAIIQLILRYRYLRGFYNEITASQTSTIIILSEKLVCTHVFPSREAEKFASAARENRIEVICSEEYRSPLLASAERARAQGYSPDTIVKLSDSIGGDWYKVSFTTSKVGNVLQFISNWTPVNDLMNMQKSEHEKVQKMEAFRSTMFDLVWCIDVENRTVTLFNDALESRHGTVTKAAGTYDLREVVLLQDYLHFESRLNTRVKDFVKYGVDFGSDNILNLRLNAPQHTTVWHALRGVLVRGDNGRLLMYGTSHRLDKLEFPNASATDFSNMFGKLLGSSVLRVFWCDMDGNIQGGNAAYARDMGVQALDELKEFNLADVYNGPEKQGMQLLYSIFNKMKSEKGNGPLSRCFSFVGGKEMSEVVSGQFELIPLTNETGELTGGLFIYWLDIKPLEKQKS